MAKDQGVIQTQLRRRNAGAAKPGSTEVAAPGPNLIQTVMNLPKFLREVQVEGRKVTWTTWKETWITSVMVGIMVVLTALFFFSLDWLLHLGISAILKLANAE